MSALTDLQARAEQLVKDISNDVEKSTLVASAETLANELKSQIEAEGGVVEGQAESDAKVAEGQAEGDAETLAGEAKTDVQDAVDGNDAAPAA